MKKIKDFDLGVVFRFAPDVGILEIGTNDLCNISAEVVGLEIDDLVKQLSDFSVRVVGVRLVIPRAEALFNQKVKLLNRYLSVVIDNPHVFLWRHKILDESRCDFLLQDGVHLNPCGQYLLYRSLPRCNFKGSEALGSVRVRVSIANYHGKLDDFSFKYWIYGYGKSPTECKRVDYSMRINL